MAVTIGGSVGWKGRNNPDDVRKIHMLLKGVPVAKGGPPAGFDPAKAYSTQTDQAIYNFQLAHFAKSWSDAKVEPGLKTLAKLNELSRPVGVPPPVPVPAKPEDPARARAKAEVDRFAARSPAGKFMRFRAQDIIADLKARIDDPTKIDQKRVGLCPSASVLYALAMSDVVAYARLVMDLYEKGEARLNKWHLKPGPDLLRYALPANMIAPVDWIPMASIRDSENWFVDYQAVEDNGGGWGNEVARWLRRAGYSTVLEEWRLLGSASPINLERADILYKSNHHVLLLINGGALRDETDWTFIATHWVVLASPIQFGTDASGDRTVKFTVYTWGKRQEVPTKGVMKMTDFLKSYYGFVACKL